MSKIAVMGDYDSVYGFGALGLDTFRVTDAVEGAELLKKLAEGEYGVIYMTEQLGEMLKKERAKYDDRISPAIILIPGVSGNTGEGITGVKGSAEKAVGSDILFGDM